MNAYALGLKGSGYLNISTELSCSLFSYWEILVILEFLVTSNSNLSGNGRFPRTQDFSVLRPYHPQLVTLILKTRSLIDNLTDALDLLIQSVCLLHTNCWVFWNSKMILYGSLPPTFFVFVVLSLSHAQLLAIPWTVACQAPLFMGLPRQEYWSWTPFPSPEDPPESGIEPVFPALVGGFFISKSPGKPF